MLGAIASGKSLFSGVIRMGGGVLGGVYAADMLWLLAQKEGRIQQIAEPIIKRAEETSPKYIIVGAPIVAMGLHALFSCIAELAEFKPIIAVKTAMGVYDFSIPFLLSGAMLVRCRSKLKGNTSVVLQLFWHLVKEGTYGIGGEVYRNIEILARDVAEYLEILKELCGALEKEKRDLDSAIDIIRGKNRSETLTETLNNAAAFAEHLRDWNQRIQGLEEKLHDYVTLANARKDSFDEAPYDALEKAVQHLESVSAEEREQVTLLYQTFYGVTDCFEQVERQMEEIRTLRQEIEQLFLKGEHLVDGALFIAEMNDIEADALRSWDETVRDMRTGFAGNFTTMVSDGFNYSPRRGPPAQTGKQGAVANIADDSSSFTELKRRELERRDSQTCRKLSSSLSGLRTRREATVLELEQVHAPLSIVTVHKPFFQRDKEMVDKIKRDLEGVRECFARHKLSRLDRERLREREYQARRLAYTAPGLSEARAVRAAWNWWNQG